jgi:hypothetical protein
MDLNKSTRIFLACLAVAVTLFCLKVLDSDFYNPKGNQGRVLATERARIIDSLEQVQADKLIRDLQAEQEFFKFQLDSILIVNENLQNSNEKLTAELITLNRVLGKRPRF